MALDSANNLYVADTNSLKIRKISIPPEHSQVSLTLYNLDDETDDATITLTSSDTGEATVSPSSLTFTGNNWNTNQTVTVTGVNDNDRDRHQAYKISLSAGDQDLESAEVTTFAGSSSGSVNATGTSARFQYPRAITTDGTNLYVADRNNHTYQQ